MRDLIRAARQLDDGTVTHRPYARSRVIYPPAWLADWIADGAAVVAACWPIDGPEPFTHAVELIHDGHHRALWMTTFDARPVLAGIAASVEESQSRLDTGRPPAASR